MTEKGKDNFKDNFSFDSAPDKIGEQKENVEFTFSDVPVLGKEVKKNASIKDLLGTDGKQPISRKRQRDNETAAITSFEEMMKGGAKASGGREHHEDDVFKADEEDWTMAAKPSAKKLSLKKIIIIASSSLFLLLLIAGAAFFMKKDEADEPQNNDSKKPAVSEEERRRAAAAEDERKKIEDEIALAGKLVDEGSYAEAESALGLLIAKGPQKAAIYSLFGKLYLKQGKNDEALDNYLKAIAFKPSVSEAYTQACGIYIALGKAAEGESIIEKAMAQFPEDQNVLKKAGVLFTRLGKKDKAAEIFGKMDKTLMSQADLGSYALLLKNAGQIKKAKEIYIYSGKKFMDLESFEKAITLESDPLEKTTIINTAMGVFEKDPQKKNKMLLSMISTLIRTGKKDLADEKLKTVEVENLSSADCIEFAQMTLKAAGNIRIKDSFDTVITLYSSNYDLLKKLQNMLDESGRNGISAELFLKLWTKNPGNPDIEYLYARNLAPLESAIGYYKDAIKKKPQFFDALFDMGVCFMAHRRYDEAATTFNECLRINPSDGAAKKNLFLSQFLPSKNKIILEDYENYLKSAGWSRTKTAVELIEYAQSLNDPSKSDAYLEEMKNSGVPGYDYWRIRGDMIYRRDTEKDFSSYYPKDAREFHMLYLLGKGKIKDVLLMPTPPSQFPEFWKIFLMWRHNIEEWKELAMVFAEKNRENSSMTLISLVILGEISADDARKQIYKVSHELDPIFFLVLAEQYRRDKNIANARVCYTKAVGESPNIYKRAIQYFENH
jgi:tetratricopeptide (TPR) repeat protein